MNTDNAPLDTLAADIMRLEQVEETTFRSGHAHDNSLGIVFGGQFLAQALLAAAKTAPGWPAHSCSAYFLRPGTLAAPIDYAVELVRDGKAFANRRVVARQAGKVLFDMLCSFHAPGPGLSHQVAMPQGIPGPEELPDIQDYLAANADRIPREEVASYFLPLPVQFRLIDPDRTFHVGGTPQPRRSFWMRFPSAAQVTDIADHQPLIALVSDYWIGPVATELHGPSFPGRHPVATISHAMTFHAPARADDWMLYQVDSPWAGDGLGLTRGLLFDRAGTLLATAVQEVVIRS